MLQEFREKLQGLLAKFLIALIIASFAFWGIGNYLSRNTANKVAAKVNSESIPLSAVNKQYERLVRRQADSIHGLDTNWLKQQVLETLISQTAILQEAEQHGLTVSKDQIRNIIINTPDFQVDGQFSVDRYQDILSSNLYTDLNFREEIKKMVLVNHLQYGLIQSAFSFSEEVKNMLNLLQEKRDITYAVIPSKKFEKQVTLTQDDVNTYYQSHLEQFKTDEKVKIAFIELSLSDLMKQYQPTLSALKAFYEDHQDKYQGMTRLHAAHILISVPPNASQDVRMKATDKLAKVQAALAAGGDFAQLAKQYSDDTGTKEKEGDLGWFGDSEMVPAFSKAAFALRQPGDISEPVKTEFGFHLIRLIDRQEPKKIQFEDVENEVKQAAQAEWAQMQLLEKADELATLSFEHPQSLVEASDRLQSPIKTSDWFSLVGGAGKNSLTQEAKVIQAAFSDEVLIKGLNSPLLELSPEQYVVLRVTEHMPSQQLTLEAVKQSIHQQLTQQKAQALAMTAAENLKKELKTLDTQEQAKRVQQTDWQWEQKTITRDEKNLNPVLVVKSFDLPSLAKEQDRPMAAINLPDGDVALLILNKIIVDTNQITASQLEVYQSRLASSLGEQDFQLYTDAILLNAEIERRSLEF